MKMISRRNYLKWAGVGLVALLLSLCGRTMGENLPMSPDDSAGISALPKKPNFLVILVDDMGFSDVGCYGGEIQTPNIDGLAAKGVRFSNFYNSGRCWPSRAALLTGYYAQQVRRDTFPGSSRGGNAGVRPTWASLLPAYLKPLGYRSYHTGKWHIDGKPEDNGFDLSFNYGDSDHHFLSEGRVTDTPPLQPRNTEGYYSTIAIADQAIRQLRDHASKFRDKPFFEYVAFTEPHFPLQALQADIDRYRDAYLKGWDKLREERWARMKEQGIVNCALSKLEADVLPGWNLTPAQLKEQIGPGEVAFAVAWDTLTGEQKRYQATKMAIHAAMVDRIDREIGRILDQLKIMKACDNTVILFLSDNGASAEQMIRGGGHDKTAPLGSRHSFICLGPGFSSAANTPLRFHKSWVHEGGISTPLIVHWPEGIKAGGEWRHDLGHVVDIAPTLLDLAGGQWPETVGGAAVPAHSGKSLVPAFTRDGSVNRDFLWWSHGNNRAIRAGDWKLVSKGKAGPWELYDMNTDRCESVNLANKNPDKVKELSDKWMQCAESFMQQAKADGPVKPAKGKGKNKAEDD